MHRVIIVCLTCLYLFPNSLLAQTSVEEKGKLSGLIFGDYYWMAKHHDQNIEGNNGFWFRRIYLTYDHQLSESFSGRIRFEASSAGDFESNTSMVPDIKDAYLKWSHGNQQILAGISSVPTFGLVEDIWGYRSIEKTPLDLFNFASSRDFGIAFKGKVGKTERLQYHFFFGNGTGNKTELNKGKKLMLSLGYNITKHLIIEGYADWNREASKKDIMTTQGFIGYRSKKINIGALYAYQLRERTMMSKDLKLDLASIFGSITFTDKIKGFLRADHLFDEYIKGASNDYLPFSTGAESSTFIVGGVDLALDDNIHLLPNVESIIYGKGMYGSTPKTDIVPRMTLSVTF